MHEVVMNKGKSVMTFMVS